MALIQVPMTAAMKRRARAALAAAELPEDTEMSPREFRHLVLQTGTKGLSPEDEATFRAELTKEGWFTNDAKHAATVNGERGFVADANKKVKA